MGKRALNGSAFVRLATDYQGECLTDAFDVRTRNKSSADKMKVKTSRLSRILTVEGEDVVNFKEPWRKRFSINRARAYGSLLGKNTTALLTLVVPDGGLKKEEGCLPGPGAKSGHRFISGNSLGIDPSGLARGVLFDDYDASDGNYKRLRRRLLHVERS